LQGTGHTTNQVHRRRDQEARNPHGDNLVLGPECQLRLCITKTGVKTWYVTKWDKAEQKIRNFTIGPWAANGTNTAWAKEQVGRKALDVIEGKQQTREERKVELAGIPTLRMAFVRTLDRRLKRPVN